MARNVGSRETIYVHPNTDAAHARQLAVALERTEMMMEVSVQSASRTADKYDSVRWPSVKDRRAGWSRTATASGDEGHHMRHETLARRRRVRSVMGVPSNQGHGGQELGSERIMTVSDVSAA